MYLHSLLFLDIKSTNLIRWTQEPRFFIFSRYPYSYIFLALAGGSNQTLTTYQKLLWKYEASRLLGLSDLIQKYLF